MKLGVSRRSCAVRGLAPLVLLDGQGALGADELYPINAHALVKPNFAHEVIALYIHDHNMGGTLASFTLLLPFACALRPKGRSLPGSLTRYSYRGHVGQQRIGLVSP